MDEDNLRSLSYNELKIIALEHDIFKSIKSKKKDVLLKRLIDFFNKDSNAVCDPKTNQLNLPNSSPSLNPEDVTSPKKRKKRINASKKLDITSDILPAKLNRIEMVLGAEGKENMPEPMSIDEVSEAPKKRGRKPKGRKQISNETLDACSEMKDNSNESFVTANLHHDNLSSGDPESCENSNSRRRGRKNKNKVLNKSEDTTSEDLPESLDRRGTFVVKCTEDQNIQAPFCESTCAPSKSNRTVRGRRHKSEESYEKFSKQENVQAPILSECGPEFVRDVSNIETSSESLDKPNSKVRGRRNKSKPIEKKSNEETQPQYLADLEEPEIPKPNMTPEINKKSDKKMAKGRKQASIPEDLGSNAENSDEMLNDRRGTFVVSTKEVVETNPDEISEILNNSNTVRRSRRHNAGDSKPCFPKNENSDDSKTSLCNEEALCNDLPVGPIPDGNRRGTFSIDKPGRSGIGESPLSSDISTRSQEKKRKRNEFEVNLSKEALSNTISSTQSSPRRITKKAKLVVPVTPLIFQKSIKFLTPPSGVKSNTFNKSAITYTPDPRKKSVSTPISVKKTPGQFSAKKMPNFAKIHEKTFGKMESLVKYTERKTARNILNSPLNKTFSGLKTKDKVKRSINKARREQAKSLIPVRSRSPVRLNNKENCTKALQKIPDCSVEKIREKERDIIKGVRSNKRFMLQMKMRNLAP